MKTNKRVRKIVTLATILLIFAILLYLQNLQKNKQTQTKGNPSQGPKSSYESIFAQVPAWDEEAVTSIAIAKEQGRIELQKTNGWVLGYPSGIPVQPGAIPSLVRNSFSLRGKKLDANFDLRQSTSQERYGFDQTWLTIDFLGSLQSSEGQKDLLLRILIGAEVPGLGGYYATIAPDLGLADDRAGQLLFRLSAVQVKKLAQHPNDLRKQQLAEVALLSNREEHLQTLELHSSSSSLRIEFKDEEKKYPMLNELQSFVMTKPYLRPQGVDQYQLELLLKNIPNPIKILSYIEDSPEDLSIYGLDKPQKLYARDNTGNTLDLQLGKEADNQSIYAMQTDLQSIFTVSKEVLAAFQFEPFKIVDKFVVLVNITNIDHLRLRQNGQINYTLKILHNAADDNTTDINGSRINESRKNQERNLSADTTKDLYQEFLSIFFVGEVSDSFFPVDKAELSLIYFFRDGRQKRADFYNYSAKDYYVVSIDNRKATFVTEKRQLHKLLQTVAQVLKTGQLDIVN